MYIFKLLLWTFLKNSHRTHLFNKKNLKKVINCSRTTIKSKIQSNVDKWKKKVVINLLDLFKKQYRLRNRKIWKHELPSHKNNTPKQDKITFFSLRNWEKPNRVCSSCDLNYKNWGVRKSKMQWVTKISCRRWNLSYFLIKMKEIFIINKFLLTKLLI